MNICLNSKPVAYLSIHKRSQREVIKEVGEIFPYIWVPILSQALVIKPIDLSDLSALMVPSQNGDSVGKSHLHKMKEHQ